MHSFWRMRELPRTKMDNEVGTTRRLRDVPST